MNLLVKKIEDKIESRVKIPDNDHLTQALNQLSYWS